MSLIIIKRVLGRLAVGSTDRVKAPEISYLGSKKFGLEA